MLDFTNQGTLPRLMIPQLLKTLPTRASQQRDALLYQTAISYEACYLPVQEILP